SRPDSNQRASGIPGAVQALRDQQIPVSKIDLFDLETSQIDWSQYKPRAKPVFQKRKQPRDHQKRAIADVLKGLETADRGKPIMACGKIGRASCRERVES